MTDQPHVVEDLRIAFAVSFGEGRKPGNLREIWWWTGNRWRAAGLRYNKRTHPEPLVALFAAAELNRRKSKPERLIIEKERDSVVWSMAKRALSFSKTRYLAHIGIPPFSEQDPSSSLHPFFGAWFCIAGTRVLLRADYVTGNHGEILFYDVTGVRCLDEMTEQLESTALSKRHLSSSSDLRRVFKSFRRRQRKPSGAALRGAKRKPKQVRHLHSAEDRPVGTTDESLQSEGSLRQEVLDYLSELALTATQLPKLFPERIRSESRESEAFNVFRQEIQFVGREVFKRAVSETPVPGGEAVFDTGHSSGNSSRLSSTWVKYARSRLIEWQNGEASGVRRAVILSDPGGGKTWFLRHEAYRAAREITVLLEDNDAELSSITIPILADLSTLNRTDDELEDAIICHLGKHRSIYFKQWLVQALKTDHWVLFLDGLDEVPLEQADCIPFSAGYRQRLKQRLESFAARYSRLRIVISCRTIDYDQLPIELGRQAELQLCGFGDESKNAFVEAWFCPEERSFSSSWRSCSERSLAFLVGRTAQSSLSRVKSALTEDKQLGDLGSIPLFLTLVCRTFEQSEGETIVPRRGELYYRCLLALLYDWRREKGTVITGAQLAPVIEFLAIVSYELMLGDSDDYDERVLHDVITDCMRSLPEVHTVRRQFTPASFMDMLLEGGVLVRDGDEPHSAIRFVHKAFREYLAALALARKKDELGWWDSVLVRVHDVRWTEVLTLLGEPLGDQSYLYVAKLLRECRNDVLAYPVRIALGAISEMPDRFLRTLEDAEVVDSLHLNYSVCLQRVQDERMKSLKKVLILIKGIQSDRFIPVGPFATPEFLGRPKRDGDHMIGVFFVFLCCQRQNARRWSHERLSAEGPFIETKSVKNLASVLLREGESTDILGLPDIRGEAGAHECAMSLLGSMTRPEFSNDCSTFLSVIGPLGDSDVAEELLKLVNDPMFGEMREHLFLSIAQAGGVAVAERLLSMFHDPQYVNEREVLLMAVSRSWDATRRDGLIDLAEGLEKKGEFPWFLEFLDLILTEKVEPLPLYVLPPRVRSYYERIVELWEELADHIERAGAIPRGRK